jgi:glutamyl-tRNA synthetase
LNKLEKFNAKSIEETLRKVCDNLNIKAAELIHPSRLALTTETVSPGIFDIFEFFGKDESIKRLEFFVKKVKEDVFPD